MHGASFEGNASSVSGGSANGGAVYNAGTADMDGASFLGNSAVKGGAVYNLGALTVANSSFEENAAVEEGTLRMIFPARSWSVVRLAPVRD